VNTTIQWQEFDTDAIPKDTGMKGRKLSQIIMIGNSVTGEVYEGAVRWDFTERAFCKAFDADDFDVEFAVDFWALWPTINA
jgi:hypothetical protein